MKKGKKRYFGIEFVLGSIIVALIIISLLSKNYVSFKLTSFLIIAFIIIKVVEIARNKNSILEDYLILSLIIIFGITYYITEGEINAIALVIFSLILLYSLGIIPSANKILKAKSITSFVISYSLIVISIIFLFAGIYSIHSSDFINLKNEKIDIAFGDAFYFSTITFSTVGYGDISPAGINKLISSFQSIMAIIMNIAFIGYILASKRFRK